MQHCRSVAARIKAGQGEMPTWWVPALFHAWISDGDGIVGMVEDPTTGQVAAMWPENIIFVDTDHNTWRMALEHIPVWGARKPWRVPVNLFEIKEIQQGGEYRIGRFLPPKLAGWLTDMIKDGMWDPSIYDPRQPD